MTLFLRDLAVNDMSSSTLRLYLRSVALVSFPLGIHVGRPPVVVRPRPAAALPDRANQLSIRPPEVNARFLYGLPGAAIVGVAVGSPVGVTGEFEPAGLRWQDGSRGSASADGAGLGPALNAEGDVAVVPFDVAQDAGGNSEDPARGGGPPEPFAGR